MIPIFKRSRRKFGGAFTSDQGMVSSSVPGLDGILMMGLQTQFSQRLSRIYDLGVPGDVPSVYHVSGPAEGTTTPQHVIGMNKSMEQYFTAFGDPCQAGQNTLSLTKSSSECNGTRPLRMLLEFCTMRMVAFTLSVQDFMIQTQSAIDFSGMQYEDGGNSQLIGSGIGSGVTGAGPGNPLN
jgi:hypothetical protein